MSMRPQIPMSVFYMRMSAVYTISFLAHDFAHNTQNGQCKNYIVWFAHKSMTFLHTFRGICNMLIYNDKLLAFKTGGNVVRSFLCTREVPAKSCAMCAMVKSN